MARRVRLGLLGPILVAIGAAVAALGIWYVMHARPEPGTVIDRFSLDDTGRELVVLTEANGDNSFVELRRRGRILWQALVPHYAGSPGRSGIAWGANAVTVRVERSGRAEVFALTMLDAAKLGGFRLAPEHEPIKTQATGPITLTDHVRSYEIAGGPDWHQMVAVDLASGRPQWKADLGPEPLADGGVAGDRVWVRQGAKRRGFNTLTGTEDPSFN